MFSTVLNFPEGSYCTISATKTSGFPTGESHDELKATGCTVISLHSFWFLLAFSLRGKMTNTISSSLRSFRIYRKWNERRECKVLYEEEGTVCSKCVFLWILWRRLFKKTSFEEHVRATVSEYSRIEFRMNIAQLIILYILQHSERCSLLRTPVLYSLLVQLLMEILILFI